MASVPSSPQPEVQSPKPISDSPTAYTTSFRISPKLENEEPNIRRMKEYNFPEVPDVDEPLPESSKFTTISRDSQFTAVNSDANPFADPDAFWGEQKRVWIAANSDPDSIVPQRRTLVLCFDGTGDQFDGDVRNSLPRIYHLSYINECAVLHRIQTWFNSLLC